jgi:hypothetical protein
MGPKWEYNWFFTGWHHDVNTVLAQAMGQANYLGEYKWEIITFQMREKGDEVSIVAMLKRLRPPSVDDVSPVRALEGSDASAADGEDLPPANTKAGRSRSKSRRGIRSK